MAKIIWTSEAERWLIRIFDHISKDNPIAAAKVINGIYEKAQILLEQPNIGYVYEHAVEEIRILLCGHYRISYLVNSNDDIILGVFHGALQIEKYPKKMKSNKANSLGSQKALLLPHNAFCLR